MEALGQNKGLAHLELKSLGLRSKNNMGALRSCLKQNTTLTSLELRVNHINDADVELIAEGLKSNSGLNYLGLAYNAITDEGVFHLAQALKENTTLIHLNLKHTLIGEEGARHLLKVLETNTTLLRIDLEDHTGISNETWILIKERLNRNRLLASKPIPMPEAFPAMVDLWNIVREYVGKPADDYLKPILKGELKTARYAKNEPIIPSRTEATKPKTSFFSKLRNWLKSVWEKIAGIGDWFKNKFTSKSASKEASKTPKKIGSKPPSQTVSTLNQQQPTQTNRVNTAQAAPKTNRPSHNNKKR
jgi:hypothetical protein